MRTMLPRKGEKMSRINIGDETCEELLRNLVINEFMTDEQVILELINHIIEYSFDSGEKGDERLLVFAQSVNKTIDQVREDLFDELKKMITLYLESK